MQTASIAYTRAEVARLLGWSEITFSRKYKALVENDGFPARMPGGTFYRPAVERWMASASGMDPTPAPAPLAAQRGHLKLIYGGVA